MPGNLNTFEEMERGAVIITLAVHAKLDADDEQDESLKVSASVGQYEYRANGDARPLVRKIFEVMGEGWNPPEAIVGMLRKYGLDRETLQV